MKMSSTNSNLTAEGKKYISLIELAQASGNAKEVYSLANQLIQSDIDAPEGYYYKAITTTSMKEGMVVKSILPAKQLAMIWSQITKLDISLIACFITLITKWKSNMTSPWIHVES